MRRSAPADKLSTSHRSKGKVSSVGREIKLDGGEISILKKIGLAVAPPLRSRGADFQTAATALALARRDHHRAALRRVFPSIQLRLALLVRAHAIARGDLVFAGPIETPVALRHFAWVRRGHFIFLERLSVAPHRDGSRMDF